MLNRKTWITTVAALSTLAALSVSAPVMAQYKFETPNGHQTVAPSQMPQTPMPWQIPNQGVKVSVGNLQIPMGIKSSVTRGPMYEVPVAQRVLLGLFLLLQFVVVSVIAIALTREKNEDIALHHGHLIDPDYVEPSSMHRV